MLHIKKSTNISTVVEIDKIPMDVGNAYNTRPKINKSRVSNLFVEL